MPIKSSKYALQTPGYQHFHIVLFHTIDHHIHIIHGIILLKN